MHRTKMKISALFAAAAVMLSSPAYVLGKEADGEAESPKCEGDCTTGYRFLKLHLAAGGAFETGDDLHDSGFGDKGVQATVGATFSLSEMFAISAIAGYNGFAAGGEKALSDMFVAGGFKLKLLVDRSSVENGGKVLGSLWADLHLGYDRYNRENHGGYDVGVGYEFSIFKDIDAGPYARVHVTPIGEGLGFSMIALGIEVSFGAKLKPDDQDGDKIFDEVDKCPDKAEDKDRFEDNDGCPDNDNDRDKIFDEVDKCPDKAEDKDGFKDNDGCPDNDNDRDKISDNNDKCPVEAEDKDGFDDNDGCPDSDNDGDKILDKNDKCPDQAEDKDGFDDNDGCPDSDNDGDKILDNNDKCPDAPEILNGQTDDDGCPDLLTFVGSRIEFAEKISFETANGAAISKKSYPALEELAEILKLKKGASLRIEGHTSSAGNSKFNIDLSKARADSVAKFLAERGVEASRLETQGFGGTKPVADDSTKEGREANRRIELTIADSESTRR